MRDGHEIIDPGEDLPPDLREELISDLRKEVRVLQRALGNIHKALDPYYPSDEYVLRAALNSQIALLQERVTVLQRTDR